MEPRDVAHQFSLLLLLRNYLAQTTRKQELAKPRSSKFEEFIKFDWGAIKSLSIKPLSLRSNQWMQVAATVSGP